MHTQDPKMVNSLAFYPETNICQLTEEELRNETEIVFMSYSFHLSGIESNENEDTVPIQRETMEATQLNSALDRVGRQLAIIGDDINDRYEADFNNMLRNLNPNLDNAYDYFKKIASSIFETGVNWGRIFALLGFGYRMAVYVFRNGHHGFFRTVGQYMARYVIESSIGRWLVREGGWAAVLKLTNNSIKYVLMALGTVLILQFLFRHTS
ncbi:bcl-2 homologous antagonist/killer isoform X2 [Pelobates fuscus]|uniref:bcl-2 homologous antagonist/killer isoform X2 n=1 Tax=Pelobates fuscus TaxID=191477 RepID=UPI002FE4A9AB